MSATLFDISVDDLIALNELACCESPLRHQLLATFIAEVASRNGSRALCGLPGYLMVGGREVCEGLKHQDIEAHVDLLAPVRDPVVAVSACVALLQLAPEHIPASARYSRSEIQRHLSALLLQFPVLLDHRLVFAVGIPHTEWTSLGVALAASPFASLPRRADAQTDKQYRDFACNPSVRSGLTQANGQFKLGVKRTLRGKSPMQVAMSNTYTPALNGRHLATQGGFLTSFLELNDAARAATGRPLWRPSEAAPAASTLFASLAQVAWDVGLHTGPDSAVTLDQVRSVLALQAPWVTDESNRTATSVPGSNAAKSESIGLFARALAQELDNELFGVHPGLTVHFDEDTMRQRTLRFMRSMVGMGIAGGMPAAAVWLSEATFGKMRSNPFLAAPDVQHACAIGFLKALAENSVELDVANAPTHGAGTLTVAHSAVWSTSMELLATERAMERVYADHEARAGSALAAPAGAPSSDTPRSPSRSHRRAL